MTLRERIVHTVFRNMVPLSFILAAKLAFMTIEYGKMHGWIATNFGG